MSLKSSFSPAIIGVIVLLIGVIIFGYIVLDSQTEEASSEADKIHTILIYDLVPDVFGNMVDGFRDEMTQLGYIDGEDIAYIYTTQLDEFRTALSDNQIDLIVSIPANTARQASDEELGDIPILFFPSADPVADWDVESLNQPGGNATGIYLGDATERRFELTVDMFIDPHKFYVVYDPNSETAISQLETTERMAAEYGIELVVAQVSNYDVDTVADILKQMPDDVDAIFLLQIWGSAVEWYTHAIANQIPLSAEGHESPIDVHPLISYGPQFFALGKQAASMADRILQGTDPGDLPIELSEFYLTIDLRTATAINFSVPDEMLLQAYLLVKGDAYVVELSPTSTDTDVPVLDSSPNGSACQAVQSSPGGSNIVCLTISCDAIPSEGFISYSETVPVESCIPEGLVGICSTDNFDTYYYDGIASSLQTGCGFASGRWLDSVE